MSSRIVESSLTSSTRSGRRNGPASGGGVARNASARNSSIGRRGLRWKMPLLISWLACKSPAYTSVPQAISRATLRRNLGGSHRAPLFFHINTPKLLHRFHLFFVQKFLFGSRAGRAACRRNVHYDRRDILLPYQLVKGGNVGLHDFVPPSNLFVTALLQHVEHLIGLVGRSGIGSGNRSCQRDEFIVETDGIVQNVLAALRLGLDKRVLNWIYFPLQVPSRIAHSFAVVVFRQTLVEIINLFFYAVHLVHSFVYFADLVANLKEQIELLLQVCLGHL